MDGGKMEKKAEYWIKKLGLCSHPEGGYFREMYRSQEIIPKKSLPARYPADRVFSTAIYFLLESHQVSKFHRLRSDEMWFYHAGSSLTLYIIEREGTLRQLQVGTDLDNGDQPQVFIEHGVWFGAKVNQENSYTLVSCAVTLGFDFEDFELATQGQLLADYPQHREIIESLTY
jgi:predicted cupin superfamily sugar epimerase